MPRFFSTGCRPARCRASISSTLIPGPRNATGKNIWSSPRHLDRLARGLAPGGEFRVASDIASYVEWTLLNVTRRSDFTWTAERADDWRRAWPGWPGTRYEAKALREGRTPAYLTFRRC